MNDCYQNLRRNICRLERLQKSEGVSAGILQIRKTATKSQKGCERPVIKCQKEKDHNQKSDEE